MICVSVPKEIKEYEKKVIKNLTLRNMVCLGIGIGLSILFCVFLTPYLGSTIIGYAVMLIVIPSFITGFIKFQDMIPGEKYMQMILFHYRHKQKILYDNGIDFNAGKEIGNVKKKKRNQKIKETE